MLSKQDARKTGFETLAKGAYLDVLLPKTSHFDAVTLVESGSAEELAKAPTRRNLFFGMQYTIPCEVESLLIMLAKTREPEYYSYSGRVHRSKMSGNCYRILR